MIIAKGLTTDGVQYEIDDAYIAPGEKEAMVIDEQRRVAFEILQKGMSA